MRFVLTLVVCTVALLSSPAFAAGDLWTVRKGDTLTAIARRHGVSVDDLRRWNDLQGDVIRRGHKLHVRPLTHRYTLRRGDTLSAIALRQGTTVAAVLELNRGLRPNRIAAGQVIELPGTAPKLEPEPEPEPQVCPERVVQLRSHRAYRLRNMHLAWATRQTSAALKRGFDHVRRKHPDAPRVRVLDASAKGAGPLGEHRSHHDGRDVDITYYQKKCGSRGCRLRDVKPSQLDSPRQWTLLRYWLDNDDVEFLFVDHALQEALYKHASKQGVPKKKLRKWFQYPRAGHVRAGIIRHWDAHRNHLHVRFRPADCPTPAK